MNQTKHIERAVALYGGREAHAELAAIQSTVARIKHYTVQDGEEFDTRRGADYFKTKDGEWGYTPTETGHDGKPTPCNCEDFIVGFATREAAQEHAFAAWHEAESDRACEAFE